jgi:hypothetical protein
MEINFCVKKHPDCEMFYISTEPLTPRTPMIFYIPRELGVDTTELVEAVKQYGGEKDLLFRTYHQCHTFLEEWINPRVLMKKLSEEGNK